MKRVLILLSFVGLLAAVYWFAHRYWVLDDLIARESQLRAALAEQPAFAFGTGLAIYVLISLIPGTTGKSIIVGWLYGFWQAFVLVNFGLTLAAMVSFWVSRYILHDVIKARFGTRWERFNQGVERDGGHYLFTARILHAPYSVTNYVMGATRIRGRQFWLATQLGLIPGNCIFVYAGAQLPTLEEMADEGISAFFSPGLLVALVAANVFSLGMGSIVRRLSRRRKAPSDQDLDEA